MLLQLLLALVVIALTAVCAAFPILGIGVLAFLSTLETGTVPAGNTGIPLPAAALAVFLVSAGLRLGLSRQIHREWLTAFVFLAAAFLVSSLICLHPWSALQNTAVWLAYAAAAYFVGLYWPQPNTNPYVIFPFKACLLAALVLALCQIQPWTGGTAQTARGGFADAAFFGIFLTWMLPFALVAFHQANSSREAGFWAGIFLLAVGMAGITGSRGAIVLLLLTVMLCGALRLINRELILWLSPLAAVGLLHGLQGRDFGLTLHILAWTRDWLSPDYVERGSGALAVFATHPFFGVGPGQYDPYLAWAYPDLSGPAGGPNSTMLRLLAETGILGGLAFGWIGGRLFGGWYDARGWPHSHPGEKYFLRAAFVSLAALVLSFFLHAVHTHLFTWCFMGMLYGCFRDAGTVEPAGKLHARRKPEPENRSS